MAGILHANDSNQAIAALFGRPSTSLQCEIEQDLDRFVNRVGGTAAGLAERAKRVFHDVTVGAFARGVNSIRTRINRTWDIDNIRALSTLDDLQNAKPRMRKYVMAHPKVRKLYHDNRLEGYGEKYHDDQPGKVGRSHYDYRQSISGILLAEKNKAGETEYNTRVYLEKHIPEFQLSINEKAVVQQTWAAINDLLEEGIYDMTSDDNALMG